MYLALHRVKDIKEERRKLSSGPFVRTLTITTEEGTAEIDLFSDKLEYLHSNRTKTGGKK